MDNHSYSAQMQIGTSFPVQLHYFFYGTKE